MANLDSRVFCGEDGRWHVVFEGKESSKTYDHAPEAQKALREMRKLDSTPSLNEGQEWLD